MSKFEQIIAFAIEREEEAVNFYDNLADQILNPASKELLIEFKNMELDHIKILRDIKPDSSKFFIDESISSMNLSDYFVEVMPNQEMTYQEVITLAMKREFAAHKLYMDMANSTNDMEAKLLFIALADQEIKHKLKLETIYDDEFYKEN